MLEYEGTPIIPEPYDERLYTYVSSFFDLGALLDCIKIQRQGYRVYNKDKTMRTNKIILILKSTKNYKNANKYNTYRLDCKEWDIYWEKDFAGFTDLDLKRVITKFVVDEVYMLKRVI